MLVVKLINIKSLFLEAIMRIKVVVINNIVLKYHRKIKICQTHKDFF